MDGMVGCDRLMMCDRYQSINPKRRCDRDVCGVTHDDASGILLLVVVSNGRPMPPPISHP